MTEDERIEISKFLTLILRHNPEKIGITLDPQGWTDTEILTRQATEHGFKLTLPHLKELVDKCDKQRFSLTPDFRKIRANQGHSVEVDLGLEKLEPPVSLFHGTARQNLDPIYREGLHRGSRHHVHLSVDQQTAIQVGQRYGEPVVLRIRTGEMHRHGYDFFRSVNGVWLTHAVPPEFIEPD